MGRVMRNCEEEEEEEEEEVSGITIFACTYLFLIRFSMHETHHVIDTFL
jgi:hypothetical protein